MLSSCCFDINFDNNNINKNCDKYNNNNNIMNVDINNKNNMITLTNNK